MTFLWVFQIRVCFFQAFLRHKLIYHIFSDCFVIFIFGMDIPLWNIKLGGAPESCLGHSPSREWQCFRAKGLCHAKALSSPRVNNFGKRILAGCYSFCAQGNLCALCVFA